jgi:hypothetical protein
MHTTVINEPGKTRMSTCFPLECGRILQIETVQKSIGMEVVSMATVWAVAPNGTLSNRSLPGHDQDFMAILFRGRDPALSCRAQHPVSIAMVPDLKTRVSAFYAAKRTALATG